jgi:hypothetical protein
MKIGGKGNQNIVVNMGLTKKKLKKDTNSKRHVFMPLHLGMG